MKTEFRPGWRIVAVPNGLGGQSMLEVPVSPRCDLCGGPVKGTSTRCTRCLEDY